MHRAIASALILLATVAPAFAEDDASPAVAAPDIPDTDIFIGRIASYDSTPIVGSLKNATRRKGYDNQPSFVAGKNAFYYVADGKNGKTDIRLYDIDSGKSRAVAASKDRSEYSPKEAPGGGISYIQENPEGDVTRVYRRSLTKKDDGAPVADFAPLGYYAWLDGGKALGVYYRSEPGSLYRVDVTSGEKALLHDGIGRAMASDKTGAHLWFTGIAGDDEAPAFDLMRYDTASGAIAPLFALPPGSEDFALLFDENGGASVVLATSAAKLYSRSLGGPNEDWAEIADLSQFGVAKATRIAVSDNESSIAIVAETAGQALLP